MSDLGKRLKDYRDKLGYSLKQVNSEVGITNSRLSKMERGKIKYPPAKDLKKLANLYGASVVDFYIDVGYLEPSDLIEYQQVFHGIPMLDVEEKEYVQESIDLLNRKKV